MLKYFFHVHDGVSKPDQIGVEFASEHEAWGHALVACGEFLREHGQKMPIGSELMMDVMDENGKRHWLLTFRAEN